MHASIIKKLPVAGGQGLGLPAWSQDMHLPYRTDLVWLLLCLKEADVVRPFGELITRRIFRPEAQIVHQRGQRRPHAPPGLERE